ncbi:MAG: CoA transferase, partial [Actinomycetota bacterium]|nr:CoA transferase [Actinomycetota bacterium]
DECPIFQLPNGEAWGIAGNPLSWFEQLTEAMDRPDLLDDPRFCDIDTRYANRAELNEVLTEWAATFDSFDAFCSNLEERSPFTAARLRSIHQLAESDFAAHRGLFTETNTGIPIPAQSAVGSDIGTNGRIAARGTDNAQVLADVLGYDDTEIGALTEAGILLN